MLIDGYKDVITAANSNETINCAMKLFQDVCEYLDLPIGIAKKVKVSDFNYLHLDMLVEKTHRVENELVQLIQTGGGIIKTYDSLEQFIEE